MILQLNHFNGNEPVTQLYSAGALGQYESAQLVQQGSRAIEGAQLEEREQGTCCPLAGFTESPANSPAQDLALASLSGEKYIVQTVVFSSNSKMARNKNAFLVLRDIAMSTSF